MYIYIYTHTYLPNYIYMHAYIVINTYHGYIHIHTYVQYVLPTLRNANAVYLLHLVFQHDGTPRFLHPVI